MNRITRREFLAIGAIPVLAPIAASELERRAWEPVGARIAMQLGRPTLFLDSPPALAVIYAPGHCPGSGFNELRDEFPTTPGWLPNTLVCPNQAAEAATGSGI